ncbi:MAG: MIP/aquaporin family protein [Bdellovibrionota bacterium]
MKNYLVEFIGTFFLVFVIGLTVLNPGAGAMAPVAIGCILMVMVYSGGPISGGHYNPAVTLAVFLRTKGPTKDVMPYWVSQFLAAGAASQLVLILKPGAVITPTPLNATSVLIVESLFTFALCFVVLSVATSKKTSGNSYFGLAIGATVLASAYAAGPISGGAFNPAVALGTTLMGLSGRANLWTFLLAEFIGGAIAALIYRAVNPDEVA